MEQYNDFMGLRVDGCQIRPFLQVAPMACQGQVRKLIQSAVLLRDNVLKMMGKWAVMLGKEAIFAAELRSNADPIPNLAGAHGWVLVLNLR